MDTANLTLPSWSRESRYNVTVMVEVNISRDKKGRIVQFGGSGHSGYAKEGKDIVCAAVSTLLQTALVGLKDYLGLKVAVRRKKGWLQVETGEINGSKQKVADAILETMVLGLRYIERDYTGYLEVKESELSF